MRHADTQTMGKCGKRNMAFQLEFRNRKWFNNSNENKQKNRKTKKKHSNQMQSNQRNEPIAPADVLTSMQSFYENAYAIRGTMCCEIILFGEKKTKMHHNHSWNRKTKPRTNSSVERLERKKNGRKTNRSIQNSPKINVGSAAQRWIGLLLLLLLLF